MRQCGVTACFNGNIAATTWTYGTVTKGYNYGYDALNRLLSAGFKQGTSTQVAGAFDETFTYDKMGNILTLQRKKDNALIDNLTFGYKNGNASNQLNYISDAAGSRFSSTIKEYQNLSSSTTNEFVYDNNGNLTADADREIVTIRYNLLNLPDTIQFKNGNQIRNFYDAGGQKLRTEYSTLRTPVVVPIGSVGSPGNPNDCNDFLNGTEYNGNIEYAFSNDGGDYQFDLDKIYNDEGYAENPASPKYYYYRKDHLGDNREVWQAPPSGGGGAGTTVPRTQYYPSGLPWAEGLGADVQNKKFTDKEYIEMHGYDCTDLGARVLYNAGDFIPTPDPLCEKYYSISPYSYCAGDPVNRMDPDGMDWVYHVVDGITEAYYDRDVTSQQDVIDKYGEDSGITHLNDGSTLTNYDKDGNVTAQYTFTNDSKENKYGTVTDKDGKTLDNSQITYGNKYTIFGTSDNSCNAETLHNNYFGTSYTGPNNPKDYNGNDSYQYLPRNLSEYASLKHDLDYDKLNAHGPLDAFLNIYTMNADRELANNSFPFALKSNSNWDRFTAFAVYLAFNSIASFKSPLLYMKVTATTKESDNVVPQTPYLYP